MIFFVARRESSWYFFNRYSRPFRFVEVTLAIHNLFWPLGKAVAKLLIAIPVLLIFLKSLFTIHNLFLPFGKAVGNLLIAIPVLLNCLKSLVTIHEVFTTFTNYKIRNRDNRAKIRNLTGNRDNRDPKWYNM